MRSAVLLPWIEDLWSVGGSMPSEDGRPPTSALTFMASFHPFLQYFGILLEKGELNHLESLELAHPLIGGIQYGMCPDL